MEANEAPEKLYILFGLPYTVDYTKLNKRRDEEEVEYTRTDAFVEKARELLARMVWEVTYEDLEGNSVQHYDKMEFIEDFCKAMKGE